MTSRREKRELRGDPSLPGTSIWWAINDRLRCGSVGRWITKSRRIPGWTRGDEAVELTRVSYGLPDHAVIVENGSFLGCSTVLLAGPRQSLGSGMVHSVDPFDASGEPFSAPIYRQIADDLGGDLRGTFEKNLERAGVRRHVTIHQGRGADVAGTWAEPIDLLLLDGDQSPRGVREAFDAWWPFVKPGGIVAAHNSSPGEYAEGHDGHYLLVESSFHPPAFSDVWLAGTMTFARRRF